MKLIKGTHITATEKRAIRQMIDQGLTQAHNRPKTKVYTILQGMLTGNKFKYKVAIDTRATYTIGRSTETRRNIVTVEVSREPEQKTLFN